MEQYNLPPLDSIKAIDELDPETVVVYIAGYHLEELPEGPDQEAMYKDMLKRKVGAMTLGASI